MLHVANSLPADKKDFKCFQDYVNCSNDKERCIVCCLQCKSDHKSLQRFSFCLVILNWNFFSDDFVLLIL